MTTPVLRPEIETVVEKSLAIGQWDGAIFDAVKTVEAALQKQVGRTDLFGARLISYAFEDPADAPRVRIVATSRENHQLAQLFGGAIGFLKGDRSHKAAPSVPCPDEETCLRVLVFASYLLDLLDEDENAAPAIQAVRAETEESVELDVLRVSPDTVVLGNGVPLREFSREGHLIRVELPKGRKHVELVVKEGRRRSRSFPFESQPPRRDANFHLVQGADLPLYASPAATGQRTERAVRLQSYEGGRRFIRYFPIRRAFNPGDYVDWTWDMSGSVGESWTRGPSGDLVYAWTSAAFFDGKTIAHTAMARTIAVEIRPRNVQVRPGQKVPLRVIAYVADGPACWREDVTARAEIESLDVSVARLDQAAHALVAGVGGSTRLHARYDGRFDQIPVNVAALPSETVVEYLGGIRRVVNVVPHRDGALIAHQQDHLLLLRPDMSLEHIAYLAMPETAATGLDSMATDPEGNIYVRSIWNGELLKVLYDGAFARSVRIASSRPQRTFTSMCWSNERSELIVADAERGLWRWREGMRDIEFWMRIPLRISGLYSTPDWLLILPAVQPFGYARLSWDATTLQAIIPKSDIKYAPSAILPRRDDVLLADFHAGRIYSARDEKLEVVAEAFTNPTALALDSEGGVLVTNFGGDSLARILP